MGDGWFACRNLALHSHIHRVSNVCFYSVWWWWWVVHFDLLFVFWWFLWLSFGEKLFTLIKGGCLSTGRILRHVLKQEDYILNGFRFSKRPHCGFVKGQITFVEPIQQVKGCTLRSHFVWAVVMIQCKCLRYKRNEPQRRKYTCCEVSSSIRWLQFPWGHLLMVSSIIFLFFFCL